MLPNFHAAHHFRTAQGTMMRYLSTAVMALGCLVVHSQVFADDHNWPQWRGPMGSGVTSAAGGVTQWGPDQNVKWRMELPEPGNSTPVVWKDRVLFTQPLAEEKQRSLFCVDRATGRELWRRGVSYDKPEASHKTNPYCSASPVTDGERVIAWFGSAGLVCWDLEGNELWRRDLGAGTHVGIRFIADTARGLVHLVVRPGES